MIPGLLNPNIGPEQLPAPLQIMRLTDLNTEIETLINALPGTKPEPAQSEEEWDHIMTEFLQRLEVLSGNENGVVAVLGHKLLSNLPVKFANKLKDRLEAVQKGIIQAGLHGGGQFPQTHFCLVPLNYTDRIAHVVGKGEIPLAWIEALDTP